MGQFAHPLFFVIAALAMLGVAGEIYLRRRWEWALLLRFSWIFLVGLLLAEWILEVPKELSAPQSLRIVADLSDSVIKIPERKARLETMVQDISEWAKKVEQPLEWAGFSDKAFALNPNLQSLPNGFQSHLSSVADSETSNRVILLSDGILSDRPRWKSTADAVSLGEDDERDIWIEDLPAVETAFLKNRLKIPFTIGQQGFDGKTVHIELKSVQGEVIAEREVVLKGKITSDELTIFPEKMGERMLSFEAAPQDGEISELNNRASIRIKTVRDKIRILHVSGKPSYDLKAWRAFLTRQPDVDLVSFYILRSLNDDPEAKNSELSLIPFPYEELFTTELDKFDVVILQNFDFNLYFQSFYLANLAQFVRQGGALLMMGGDQGLDRYRDSPLEDLMPFQFTNHSEFEAVKNFKVESGMAHPLGEGLLSSFQNVDWSGRHPLQLRDSAHLIFKAMPGNIPLLSLWDVNKGRVLAFNSDESWKLQSSPRVDPTAFYRLARRVIQYLTFDPELEPSPLQIGDWKTDSDVSIEWKGAPHPLRVRSLWNSKIHADLGAAKKTHFKVPEPGIYILESEGLSEPIAAETLEQPWRGEWKDLLSRNLSLEQITRNLGGRFLNLKIASKFLISL